MITSDYKTETTNAIKILTNSEKKNYKPKTAGNKAFRLHNNFKFMQTAERRKTGKLNKL